MCIFLPELFLYLTSICVNAIMQINLNVVVRSTRVLANIVILLFGCMPGGSVEASI